MAFLDVSKSGIYLIVLQLENIAAKVVPLEVSNRGTEVKDSQPLNIPQNPVAFEV